MSLTTSEIDSHCSHMQIWTTTFLFTIILAAHEGSISENTQETMIALAISHTECQETLSERQFGKQTSDTYFVWSWRWYWFLNI